MEVLDENSAKLSNYEVLKLLQDIQSGCNGQKKPSKNQKNLATISYSTLKYLEKTPCVHQNEKAVAGFMQALAPYNLTKAEKLQLLNNRPSTAVEIQLIIEESEERLTEAQVDELLDVITENLPSPEEAKNGDVEMTEQQS